MSYERETPVFLPVLVLYGVSEVNMSTYLLIHGACYPESVVPSQMSHWATI